MLGYVLLFFRFRFMKFKVNQKLIKE
jgi:hypothetical protein